MLPQTLREGVMSGEVGANGSSRSRPCRGREGATANESWFRQVIHAVIGWQPGKTHRIWTWGWGGQLKSDEFFVVAILIGGTLLAPYVWEPDPISVQS